MKVEGCVCSECSGECSTERFVQDMTDKPPCGSNDESGGIEEESLKVEIDEVEEEVNVGSTDQLQSGTNYIKAELLDVEIDITFQKDSACKKMFKFPEEDFSEKKTKFLKKPQAEIQSDESTQKKSTGGSGKIAKKFKCFTCDYATNRSNNMKKHKMTSKHKEKMSKSSEVDFATVNNNCLKKPQTEIQSDGSIKKKSTGGSGKSGKKFKCFTCNYATTKSSHLKQHKMTSKHKMYLKRHLCKNSDTSQHQTNHSTLQFEDQDPIGDLAFKDGKCLKQHQAEIHSDVNLQDWDNDRGVAGKLGESFKCTTCEFATKYRGSLKKHQQTHSNLKPFKCTLCEFSAKTKNNLLMHRKRIHDANSMKKFECPLCDYTTRLRYHLLRHQIVHCSEKPFKCSKCDFVTKRKKALDQHNFRHYVRKPFKCPKCDYASNQKQNLKLHLRNIHAIKDGKSLQQHQTEIQSDLNVQDGGNVVLGKFGGNEMITTQKEVCQVKVEGCVCSECTGECSSEQFLQDTIDQPQSGVNIPTDFAIKNRKCLKKHHSEVQSDESIQKEGADGLDKFGKKFKCSTCNYTTDISYNLKKHNMRHSTLKPFKCTLCDFTTKTRSDLLMHWKRIHDADSLEKFKCSLCDYTAHFKYHISRHQLVHCSEKPFKCSICNFATKRKETLHQHNFVHYIEKPFKCPKCDYATKQKRSLRHHLKNIHAMDAWIQCSACDYVAGDKCSFALHQKMHRQKPCSSSEKLLCIDCNFETFSETTLIQHFQSAEHLII